MSPDAQMLVELRSLWEECLKAARLQISGGLIEALRQRLEASEHRMLWRSRRRDGT